MGDLVRAGGKIMFGKSWDVALFMDNMEARKIGLERTALELLPDGDFDIKNDKKEAPHGRYTAKLLNGKYASARSAGNYSAGYNAATVTNFNGDYITKEGFDALAGGLHGGPGGKEIPYATRMIDAGYRKGVAIRLAELKRKYK